MFALAIFIIPPLLTTLLLAAQARWAWFQTVDKILRGMKVDAVRDKVEKAAFHRKWARRHAFILAMAVVFSIVVNYLNPQPRTYSSWLVGLNSWMLIWIYALFVPHLLALYVYHLRWNPKTLQRKQKLDSDMTYEGNYDLNPDAEYGINEEGELIELAALSEEAQHLQQS